MVLTQSPDSSPTVEDSWTTRSQGPESPGPDTWVPGGPHLAQLHEEVGDPGLDAFPEGVVFRPGEAGGEGST